MNVDVHVATVLFLADIPSARQPRTADQNGFHTIRMVFPPSSRPAYMEGALQLWLQNQKTSLSIRCINYSLFPPPFVYPDIHQPYPSTDLTKHAASKVDDLKLPPHVFVGQPCTTYMHACKLYHEPFTAMVRQVLAGQPQPDSTSSSGGFAALFPPIQQRPDKPKPTARCN